MQDDDYGIHRERNGILCLLLLQLKADCSKVEIFFLKLSFSFYNFDEFISATVPYLYLILFTFLFLLCQRIYSNNNNNNNKKKTFFTWNILRIKFLNPHPNTVLFCPNICLIKLLDNRILGSK